MSLLKDSAVKTSSAKKDLANCTTHLHEPKFLLVVSFSAVLINVTLVYYASYKRYFDTIFVLLFLTS